jgi:hypothetical protein
MRYTKHIGTGFLVAAVAIPLGFLAHTWFVPTPQYELTLPAGMKIVVEVNENVGAGEQKAPIPVVVTEAVWVQGTVVIPKGSAAHMRVTKNPAPAGAGIALYSARLVDIELGGKRRPVTTNSHDIPVDIATGSPYSAPAAGLIIPQHSLMAFTLTAPFDTRSRGPGPGK